MSTITNTPTSTSNWSSKGKSPVEGRQDEIKSRMLEMAEEEHKQKMKILQLKENILLLKKQKLEKELNSNVCNNVTENGNVRAYGNVSNSKDMDNCGSF